MDLIKQIMETPGLLKEIYGDLAKPGVTQVGKALNTVLGLGNTILWPVTLLNEKAKISLENNLNKYRERISEIPKEKIIEVPPEVGVPIAEKLAYVSNDELSDMYVELLAKASTVDLANQAHPSFVNAINNISPDEAILLRALKSYTQLPFVEVQLKKTGENHWNILNPMVFNIKNEGKPLSFPQNVHAYISNFEGMGILQIRQDVYLADNSLYEALEETAKNTYQKQVESIPDHQLSFKKGKIDITPFGRMLISACIPEKKA